MGSPTKETYLNGEVPMRFHDYKTVVSTVATEQGFRGSFAEQQDQAVTFIHERVPSHVRDQLLQGVTSEARWVEDRRPYYDLYPSVAEAFLHVDLSRVYPQQLSLPLPSLVIRLAVGCEISGIQCLLVSQSVAAAGYPVLTIAIQIQDPVDGRVKSNYCVFSLQGSESLHERIVGRGVRVYAENKSGESLTPPDDYILQVHRLVAAICLLGDDPDLIEPQPLASDIDKWNKTHDLRLIEKAEKRGKRGWSVGQHIEVAPGFRRPHFAIRWMGKGEPKKPILRPIKGCLIRKKAVMEVPTGFLDDLTA